MSGTIVISQTNIFVTGTFAYGSMIEGIREILLSTGQQSLVEAVYHMEDVLDLTTISLQDLDSQAYAIFAKAALAASKIAVAEDKRAKPFWDELLGKLRKDARWQS